MLEAPGLGAPPGPSPPPSTLSVAVGKGDLEEDDDELVLFPELVEFEFEVEFEGWESSAEAVMVTTLEMIWVVSWPSLTPTEVETIVETWTLSPPPLDSSYRQKSFNKPCFHEICM